MTNASPVCRVARSMSPWYGVRSPTHRYGPRSSTTSPRLAALHAEHRLAGRSHVSLADLSAETLVINSVAGTTTLDLWPQPPRPTIGADLTTIDDWLLAIATCSGIGITPASTAALHPHPDVRFIPIDDAPTVSLVLAWPRHQPHPHTAAFVALARHAMEPGRSGPKAPGDRSI